MARPRKEQDKPSEPVTVPGATPEAVPAPKRLTPADLGYAPGDVISLHDLNRLMNQ